MYALAKKYNNEQENEFIEEELNEFKRRRENHSHGKAKSYTWVEGKSIIAKGKMNV